MKLYGHPLSGNTHRVKALLGLLGVEYEYVLVDLKAGEHKQPEFLALNPLGQVPVFVDGDLVLRDSIAAMVYIAEKFDTDNTWYPSDLADKAKVQEWMSRALNEIQHGPFMVRAIKLFGIPTDPEPVKAKATALFDTLFEPHLAANEWLVGGKPSLADLACYAYIARVTEGDYSLDAYPNTNAWLKRIEAIEDFPPMVVAAELIPAA